MAGISHGTADRVVGGSVSNNRQRHTNRCQGVRFFLQMWRDKGVAGGGNCRGRIVADVHESFPIVWASLHLVVAASSQAMVLGSCLVTSVL